MAPPPASDTTMPSFRSLEGSFASVPVPARGAGFWRKLAAFAGPGYLVAVGYMDPGNWATDIAGGSAFGYTLLSVILLSNLMAIVLQALSARLGVGAGKVDIVKVGPVQAVALGFRQSFGIMRMMATGIGQIFSGERSVRELGGPVKIAKYSGEQFSLGWSAFVSFVALISINLAFINVLPIPALDGGHLAFYAAEAVRRRPLGVRSQEWAVRTGIALVLALMVFVTFNDIASLPIFGG